MTLKERAKAQGFDVWQIGHDFYRFDAPGFHGALDSATIIKILDEMEDDEDDDEE